MCDIPFNKCRYIHAKTIYIIQILMWCCIFCGVFKTILKCISILEIANKMINSLFNTLSLTPYTAARFVACFAFKSPCSFNHEYLMLKGREWRFNKGNWGLQQLHNTAVWILFNTVRFICYFLPHFRQNFYLLNVLHHCCCSRRERGNACFS